VAKPPTLLLLALFGHGLAGTAAAQCTQSSPTGYDGNVNCNLNDYGTFFLQASGDPDGAAQNLKTKIRSTLEAFGCDVSGTSTTGDTCSMLRQDDVVGFPVGPYQGWLEGANVSLILSTALVLGGKGKLTQDLDNYFLAVAKNYRFNIDRNCGLVNWRAGNSCMDDHTVAASGYAWIAAYEYQRGRYGGLYQSGVFGAQGQIAASLSTADSVCINVWSFGDGCNGSPSDLDPSLDGQGQVFSINHSTRNNIPYGLGLMTSVASALVGLEVAGNRYWPTYEQQLVARGLFAEGQEHTLCDGADFRYECNLASAGLFTPGCLYCGDACEPLTSCVTCPGKYKPNMFPVNDVYQLYFGGVPPTGCRENYRYPAYQFTAGSYPFSGDRQEFFGAGRKVVYTILARDWLYSWSRPKLSGQFNPNPPRGYLDGIDGGGCAAGWACDPDAPWTPIQVEFKIYGYTYFTTAANLGSEDAVNQQCGGGYAHRFRYCLPAWTAGYPITAWGNDTVAGQANLPGWTCGATAPACVWTAVNNYAPRGYLDGIDSLGCAWGWGCDQDQPNTSIQVQFYGNGQYLASTVANQGSEGAVNQLCGGGFAHRFRYCLPLSTQGMSITAIGVDTVAGSSTLPGWQCPQNPACVWYAVNNYRPVGFLDGIDSFGCAWGWGCDPDQPNTSIEVRFYGDGQYIAATTANGGSEDAVNQRCGGGYAHRFRACFPAYTRGMSITAVGIDTVSGSSTLPGWQCPQNPACTW
jgi:hypothetical protein